MLKVVVYLYFYQFYLYKYVQILNNVEYINNSTKVRIICPIHGEFKQSPGKHKSGQGCSKCGRKIVEDSRRSNTENFIQKSSC